MNIWISAIGAIAALAGAWGGQWLAARREDRRWEREQHREDLRWERDVQREKRERRFNLYVDFVTATRNQQSLLTSMKTTIIQYRDGESAGDIFKAEHAIGLGYQDLAEKAAALEIVLPEEIFEKVQETILEYINLWEVLWEAWRSVSHGTNRDSGHMIKIIEAEQVKARQARDLIVAQLRNHIDG